MQQVPIPGLLGSQHPPSRQEMTTLYQDELTQTGSTTRADWFHIRSTKTLFTWMICCALVLRIVVVASSFLSIATPSYDHGQFGAEMGWVARSLASCHGFSSPFFPSTGPTALVPPLFPALLALVAVQVDIEILRQSTRPTPTPLLILDPRFFTHKSSAERMASFVIRLVQPYSYGLDMLVLVT